jgi:hypothetical protein
MAAVRRPNVRKENAFRTKATPSLFINDVPSNKFVIHTGRTLSKNKEASPNVNTTIRDDFLFSRNSSL